MFPINPAQAHHGVRREDRGIVFPKLAGKFRPEPEGVGTGERPLSHSWSSGVPETNSTLLLPPLLRTKAAYPSPLARW